MKNMRIKLILLIINIPLFTSISAQAEHFISLSMKDVIQRAIQNSGRLAAAREEQQAAAYRSKSQHSLLFPKLSFEASARYVTEVPMLTLAPAREVPFGDHHSYSVGPVLSWTVLDSGATRNNFKSVRASENQKSEEAKNTERQVILLAQLAYFKVMLASAEMSAVADSLQLAQAQYKDIHAKYLTGTTSKADSLSANREVLSLESKFLQSRSDFAQALEDIFSITGDGGQYDLSLPVTARIQSSTRESASLVVGLDPIETAFFEFDEKKLMLEKLSGNHPQIAAYSFQAEAFTRASDSAKSGHLPKIQIFGKTSLDYPNGPNLAQVHQNTVSALLTWSIFESGRVSDEVREKQALAQAANFRKEQAESDMVRDWKKTRDQLAVLGMQRRVHADAVVESEKISKLVYSSYRSGRSNYLEVQSASLRLLEAKIQSTKAEVQTLILLANLSSLVGKN